MGCIREFCSALMRACVRMIPMSSYRDMVRIYSVSVVYCDRGDSIRVNSGAHRMRYISTYLTISRARKSDDFSASKVVEPSRVGVTFGHYVFVFLWLQLPNDCMTEVLASRGQTASNDGRGYRTAILIITSPVPLYGRQVGKYGVV